MFHSLTGEVKASKYAATEPFEEMLERLAMGTTFCERESMKGPPAD